MASAGGPPLHISTAESGHRRDEVNLKSGHRSLTAWSGWSGSVEWIYMHFVLHKILKTILVHECRV